jgi:tripartite-type tricarboxylate transporter receptor subunit TctC
MPIVVVLLTLALIGLAHAQSYPTHLIKMMHGFPPGGNVDVIARIMAQEMSTGLGQPIVVESKPGAVGSVAAEAVARSAPDGYTLLTVPSAHAVTGAIYKTLKYRPLEDFDWISTVSFYPFVVCVRKDSKFHSLQDLLEAARSKAEAVSFGSSGIGTIQHMTAELLANAGKLKFLQIHYRGEALASTELLTGDIDFLISTPDGRGLAYRVRRVSRACGDEPHALGQAARRADRGGGRRARFRDDLVDGARDGRRYAGRNHRAAQCPGAPRARRAAGQDTPRESRRRCARHVGR